ncbi:MAG: hypothetical protein WCI22_18750 [Actinomycetota bacterium]
MNAPICPNCGNEITRVVDVPYGWWEWNEGTGKYVLTTAATRVDVSPWVHTDCMTELRQFHPQNPVVSV